MSLALVRLQTFEFDELYAHITSHPRGYRNLHLRQSCMRKRVRCLRYLHAIYAPYSPRQELEGIISGPAVYWRYQLRKVGYRTQVNVLDEFGSDKELDRIARRYVPELRARIRQEKAGHKGAPQYTPGALYLRRRRPGSLITDPSCAAAMASGELAPEFLTKLAGWDLMLFQGGGAMVS